MKKYRKTYIKYIITGVNTMTKSEKSTKTHHRTSPPARSLENRENQLIEKAYDVVEQRMNDGTVSAQELVHFLKMGASRMQLEKEKIEAEVLLLSSKKDIIDANKQSSEAYAEALAAFRSYNGSTNEQDQDLS